MRVDCGWVDGERRRRLLSVGCDGELGKVETESCDGAGKSRGVGRRRHCWWF